MAQNNCLNLKHTMPRLLNDPQAILSGMKSAYDAMQHASEDLKRNREFAAAQTNSKVMFAT